VTQRLRLWRENHDAILKLASYVIANRGQSLLTDRDFRGPLPLIANRGQSLFTDCNLRGPLPLIANQSKTNAQCLHQKVFVETDHTNHNILSFDAANDRQHKSGGCMPADHNTTSFLH
jgi:hypothetical protein